MYSQSWTTTESVRVILICTKPKSHQFLKEPRRHLTLSILGPFFSYRHIFQSFWTGASHYSSNLEGVETVLPHFSVVLTWLWKTVSTIHQRSIGTDAVVSIGYIRK